MTKSQRGRAKGEAPHHQFENQTYSMEHEVFSQSLIETQIYYAFILFYKGHVYRISLSLIFVDQTHSQYFDPCLSRFVNITTSNYPTLNNFCIPEKGFMKLFLPTSWSNGDELANNGILFWCAFLLHKFLTIFNRKLLMSTMRKIILWWCH